MKQVAIKKILRKKMTRMEFLVYLGTFFLVLSGIAGLIERVEKTQTPKKVIKAKQSFGSGAYGV